MMKNRKLSVIILIILGVAPLVAYGILYNQLPDQVPVHYNLEGEVDRYGSKLELLLIAVLPLVMVGLFYIIPRIDPKGKNFLKFKGFYEGFKFIMVIFMDVVFAIAVIGAIGYDWMRIEIIIPILVGCLFVFIGNYLPKAKQNFTFGIKTPWTLSSEVVWNKTHRLGGYCFLGGGMLFILIGLLPKTSTYTILLIIALTIIVLIPLVMSYVYFKQLEKNTEK